MPELCAKGGAPKGYSFDRYIWITLNGRIHSLLLWGLLLSAPALADGAGFPAGTIDSRTLRTQSKVETLYERGDYERAHFIYSHELARVGDKYAQYMTGYMYQMGQGVPEDPVRASAWYRIAAERKSPEFMAVRDQLMRTLSAGERARSDAVYLELRKEYSDLAIAMRALVKDLEALRGASTGSRVAGNSSPVTIVDADSGTPMSGAHYKIRIRRSIEARLKFITDRLDIAPLDPELSNEQIKELWARIEDYLSVVDDDVGPQSR